MTGPSVPLVVSADAGEPRLFTALLSPYRSLSRRGFTLLMTFIGVVSFIAGIGFLRMGAWPVFGMFGLDAVLIYLAFRRNYRDARAFEEIALTRRNLIVRQVMASGVEREFRFDPYWTRLEIDKKAWGVVHLALTSSGRKLPIGTFLSPDDRAAFAKALQKALADARTASPAA